MWDSLEGVKYLLRLPLIDFLADWDVKQITFTGGEPLLYKDLFVLLKHANKQNITTGFSTNGTLMTKKYLHSIHELSVDRVTVSIDGTEDVHDSIRGKGVYKKAILALGDLTELQGEYGVELNFMPLSYYRDNTYINRRYKEGVYGISFMMNRVVGFCGSFLKLGNIRDRTPEEIWKSQEFTTARIEMRKCKKCLLNCHYTPPLWHLIKDFCVYPILRKLYFR